MPRSCWGSQSRSGRSQRRSSRFTLQFRRPKHPGVSSGGKRDRESTESRRLSSVAERSRVAPARPAVEGGRAASSATPFLPSVLWCGERQPCNRRSLARATRRRLSAVDAGHTPPGFVDRGGDQQEDGRVCGPNLMSAPALVTASGETKVATNAMMNEGNEMTVQEDTVALRSTRRRLQHRHGHRRPDRPGHGGQPAQCQSTGGRGPPPSVACRVQVLRDRAGVPGRWRASTVLGPLDGRLAPPSEITEEEWGAFMDDLQQTLNKFDVPPPEQES